MNRRLEAEGRESEMSTTAAPDAVVPESGESDECHTLMRVSGYTVHRRIGVGGQAIVYFAVQESLQRPVALKVLNPVHSACPEFSARFLNEGRILANLGHSNAITIHDIGVEGDLHYLSMELVEGGDLKRRMRAGLDPETALDYLAIIADCLATAHDKNVVHRDIKPTNVLFRTDGTLLLTDFGIAKRLDSDGELTVSGVTLGSPHYLSPEQAQHKTVDGRSDIYSLGTMAFEMLTGAKPYRGNSEVDTIFQHINYPVPRLPPDLARFQELIDLMMAKSPSDRFPSARVLAEYVQRLAGGRPACGASSAPPAARQGSELASPAAVDGDVGAATFGDAGPVQPAVSEDVESVTSRRRTAAVDAPTQVDLDALPAAVKKPVATRRKPALAAPLAASMAMVVAGLAWLHSDVSDNAGGRDDPGATAPAPLGDRASNPARSLLRELPRLVNEVPEVGAKHPGVAAPPQLLVDTAADALPLKLSKQALEARDGGPQPQGLRESLVGFKDRHGAPDRPAVVRTTRTALHADPSAPVKAAGASLQGAVRTERPVGADRSGHRPVTGMTARARIEALLQEAERALQELRLTVPQNDSALAYYSEVLAIEPENPKAKIGYRRIGDHYARLARTALARDDFEKAETYVARGLRVDAEDSELQSLRVQVEAAASFERELALAAGANEELLEPPRLAPPSTTRWITAKPVIRGESPSALFRRIRGWFD